MIEIEGLSKAFLRQSNNNNFGNFFKKNKERVIALDDISIEIEDKNIFGLIGPNGAGKTTLVKTLSTLILPDSGTARINGFDLIKEDKKIRELIGVITGEYTRSLYWRLTGKQNLEFFAQLYNMDKKIMNERLKFLFEILELEEWENELVMRYSTGMKHKLALARALMNDPPILFLDEPTTGIDPKSSYEIRKFVKEKLKDKTILWTSHYLPEIDEMCDRVAMINKGKIVIEGNPREIKRRFWEYEKIFVEISEPKIELFSSLNNINYISRNSAEIKTRDLTETLQVIDRIVRENKLIVKDFKTVSPSLEEIFLKKMEES